MAHATALSPQALLTAAKGLIEAYNEKDWDRARASITPDFVYDEVATGRKVTGSDAALEIWKGWAEAFPDSRGIFHAAHVADNATVVLEVSWVGTHRGPLPTPTGSIPATDRPIAVRACVVIEVADERARMQRQYFDMATLMQQIGVGGSEG